MTRHTRRALIGAGALLVTGALALTGCGGGSGFDEGGGGACADGTAIAATMKAGISFLNTAEIIQCAPCCDWLLSSSR